MQQIPSHIFLSVLEYLYTDHVDFNVEYAMELFAAADLFDIPRLQAMCEKSMLKTIHIENAASIAGLLLTTECVLAEIPEDNAAPGGMPGGMGGGMPGMM